MDDEEDELETKACQAIEEEEIDESKIETDECDDDLSFDDQYDEYGRPLYLLCDEIWDILAEAGHGCEIVIHGKEPETLYYDDFAAQDENVRFMSHISGEMDKGYLVTVNGKNIFDLY